MNIELYEKGIEYINDGFSIIPVAPDKKPLIQWKQNQTKKADEDQLQRWSKQFPKMNLGIVTGEISQLTVIDIDTKSGQADKLLSQFPATFTVQTPSGGYHLYYKYEPGFTVSANAYPQFPSVDIRGDTGYIVASPSKTPAGEYKVIKDIPIEPFPTHLFPASKPKKTISEVTQASKGNRNDSLASFVGLLLQSTAEKTWETDVWPATQRTNMTYTPSLTEKEARAVFNSIVKKEKKRREELTDVEVVIDGEPTGEKIKLARSRSNNLYMNMSNVIAILEAHPTFRDKIRYNTFKQEIEIDGVPLQDEDTIKIQHILQTQFGLHSITRDAVYSALVHCAYANRYDEAKDWLTSLKWDGEKRLFTWLATTTYVEDNDYTRGVGTQWWLGMVKRIIHPGCIFDYMLVLVGGQGIGKTSIFRIIGGDWYKSFTGGVEGKDFYMQMRGSIVMDLDEGATLYKSEAIKIKSIITTTHDEFRAPYDRIPKKYPRHFVFSMSTNDVEPFRDATGNRRYWAVDMDRTVNFKWLEDNREQLFAEALHWLQNPSDVIPEVPEDEAREIQEQHLPDDSWAELVVNEIRKDHAYRTGDENYSTTIGEIFSAIFPQESIIRLDRRHEMRIGNVLRKELGLEKRREMVDGERKNRWHITPRKLALLQAVNLPEKKTVLDEMVGEEKF